MSHLDCVPEFWCKGKLIPYAIVEPIYIKNQYHVANTTKELEQVYQSDVSEECEEEEESPGPSPPQSPRASDQSSSSQDESESPLGSPQDNWTPEGNNIMWDTWYVEGGATQPYNM